MRDAISDARPARRDGARRPPRVRTVLGWLVAFSAGMSGMLACRPSGGYRPNLLVIVIDTLRADRLGCYGNPRGLTPFLDGLARRGTVFKHAYAASSWTCPSVASLMASRYPSQHHVNTFAAKLAETEVTWAERLAPLGYRAAGFSANPRLIERLGYAQGFHYWRADTGKAIGGLPGAELRHQALEWLDQQQHGDAAQPVLLFFQYMEPHGPYDPPEPFRSRFAHTDAAAMTKWTEVGKRVFSGQWEGVTTGDFAVMKSLYDAEVAAVDDEIRLLFEELERRGLLRDAIVVITADHGEEFWEHGRLEHGRALYNESVHVPLILVAPGYDGGRAIEENVSLIDVAPTLLDLLELPAEGRFEGRSLVPLLTTSSWRRRWRGFWDGRRSAGSPDVLFQLFEMPGPFGWAHVAGLARGPWKVLLAPNGAVETYDLAADPGELQVNPSTPSQSVTLKAALDATTADINRRAGVAESGPPLHESEKERLRALGYFF